MRKENGAQLGTPPEAHEKANNFRQKYAAALEFAGFICGAGAEILVRYQNERDGESPPPETQVTSSATRPGCFCWPAAGAGRLALPSSR